MSHDPRQHHSFTSANQVAMHCGFHRLGASSSLKQPHTKPVLYWLPLTLSLESFEPTVDQGSVHSQTV